MIESVNKMAIFMEQQIINFVFLVMTTAFSRSELLCLITNSLRISYYITCTYKIYKIYWFCKKTVTRTFNIFYFTIPIFFTNSSPVKSCVVLLTYRKFFCCAYPCLFVASRRDNIIL